MNKRKLKKLYKLIHEWCWISEKDGKASCETCPIQPDVRGHCDVDKLERYLREVVGK